MIKRWLPALLLSFTLAGSATADVKLHNLFSDGAVLQQGMVVPVWGTARDGEKVTVEALGQKAVTVAREGKWAVHLRPLKANTNPFTMTVRGDNTLEVKDLLVGEVWVLGGQSNMQFSVRDGADAAEVIPAATDPMIRLITIPRRSLDTPQQDVNASWQPCNPQTVPAFSAVGFAFGKALRKARNVPVGLINSNYGGTPAEAWTSHDVLEAGFPQVLARQAQAIENYPSVLLRYQQALRRYEANPTGRPPVKPLAPIDSYQRPSGLYNAMITPLIPYAIQGVIWYQGEGNAGRAYEYRTLFPAMIKNWRDDWKQGDFPFLFVQLAPFMKIEPQPTESAWAELREAQHFTLKALPKTGEAVITDLGDENDIHPKRKTQVGERLALAARSIAYKEKLEFSGPAYDSMKAQGDKIVLRFKHVGGGLKASGPLTGFTIAGDDKRFVNAEAEIVGDTVVVHGSGLTKPVAVRYGWANYPVVNLTNAEGLPASPFRTDDFPITTGPR
jgi:sialate O-acetylesterase